MAVKTRTQPFKQTYDEYEMMKDLCNKYRMTRDELLSEWVNENYSIAFPERRRNELLPKN